MTTAGDTEGSTEMFEMSDPTTYTEATRHHQRNARSAAPEGYSHLTTADSADEARANVEAELDAAGLRVRGIHHVGDNGDGTFEVVTTRPERRPLTWAERSAMTIAAPIARS